MERGRKRNEKIIELAHELFHEEGRVEIDEVHALLSDQAIEARISEGDENGAYVQAWVWVDFDGTELNKDV